MSLFGFYRAIVYDNADPLVIGRLRLKIQSQFGDAPTDWAYPCVSPGTTTVPTIGTGVWTVFEQGDPNHPIWVGLSQVPA